MLDERMAGWKTSMGYVENVASAIALTVDNKETTSHVLNIGEKKPLSMLERVKEIGKGKLFRYHKGTCRMNCLLTQDKIWLSWVLTKEIIIGRR